MHTSPDPSHPPGSPRSPGAVMLPGIRGGLIIQKGGCTIEQVSPYLCSIYLHIYIYVRYNLYTNMFIICVYIYVNMYIMHIWICGKMMNYPWKNTFKHQEQGMQQTNGNHQYYHPVVWSRSRPCSGWFDPDQAPKASAHEKTLPIAFTSRVSQGIWWYMYLSEQNTHNKSWFNIT